MLFTLNIVAVVLLVDIVSGLLHWLEDSYGKPDWPITGSLITGPNMLHHRRPAAFTANSWLKSAQVLIFLGALIVVVAWVVGALTWQVLLFVAIGINANEIHKWNHLPNSQRGGIVTFLQWVGVLQTSQHHGKHHTGNKDTNYCVITNLVNPVLERVNFWRALEQAIETCFGVAKRPDPSLPGQLTGAQP